MTDAAFVLLVDDSRFFLTIERQFLRNTVADIVEAESAGSALALCRERPPSLVYMAFDLPDQNGAEVCRQLKSDPRLRAIPVILICDEKRPDQETAARRAGCDGLLTRPLDRHRFLELGRSFLSGIRELRQSCRLEVRFHLGGKTLPGHGLDISNGGLFLESGEEVMIGAPLQLEIRLPGRSLPLFCAGQIAWRNTRERPLKASHPVGFGVKFTQVPEQASAALAEFLHGRRPAPGGLAG